MVGLKWKFNWDVSPGIKNVSFLKLNLLTWYAPLLMEPTGRWEFWWRTLDRKEWGFYIRMYKRIFCVIWGHYVGTPKEDRQTTGSPAWVLAGSPGTVQYQSDDDRDKAALGLADTIAITVTSYVPPPSAAGFVVSEEVKMAVLATAKEYLRLRGVTVE